MIERRYAFSRPSRPPTRAETEPTILGFAAESGPEQGDDGRAALDQEARLRVLRRSDPLAGGLLVCAGIAANVSLWLSWVSGEPQTGMSLVRSGFQVLRAGVVEPLRTGRWPGLTVVLSGGVLVLLAFLLFLPAHTHRAIGVVALVVALAATAGVTTLFAELGWSVARFGPGLWAGVAVAGFGLAGALKAMLTLPLVTTGDQES
jgi:hypothetical protein